MKIHYNDYIIFHYGIIHLRKKLIYHLWALFVRENSIIMIILFLLRNNGIYFDSDYLRKVEISMPAIGVLPQPCLEPTIPPQILG